MRRRGFIMLLGGAAAAWPPVARAQQPGMRHVAVLMGLAEEDPEAKVRLERFRQELNRLGWSGSHNVRIDTRFAPGGAQAQMLAKELVALQPEVTRALRSTQKLIRENWRDGWLFRVVSTCAGQQSLPLWPLACFCRQPIRKSGRRGQ